MKLIIYIIIAAVSIFAKILTESNKNSGISSQTNTYYKKQRNNEKEELTKDESMKILQEDRPFELDERKQAPLEENPVINVNNDNEELSVYNKYNIKSSSSNFYESIYKDTTKSEQFRKQKFTHRSDYYEEEWYENLSDLSIVMTKILCEQKIK